MRQSVIHEYFGVDASVLWKTVQEDVALLKPLFDAMCAESDQGKIV